ncbi:SUMF1/EgtB/PvdO family nonheme iron enzyme [uncultured Catenibacterium sp.]|uniref:formylglycine-generating enzyme family protein n=1 Tax=uncultured Catenibacterium sp. TaxID=286142 RepID=UPI0025CDE285|nr:SUMF1/EgtB/PvdO family nonheme iron enzyme [uncultured Catenibacterium sp.]
MKKIFSMLIALMMAISLVPTTVYATDSDSMNMFENSDFIEKEQPELTEETKQLISLYQRDPSMENYLNLRDIVIDNYNAVLVRKEEKLASLKEETAGKPGGEDKVAEMEDIVQDMYKTYWNRINSSMLRFTDSRLLKWNVSDAVNYDYIPVMGAGLSVYVKRTEVTNKEYAVFLSETGRTAPSNWIDGTYPLGEDDYPVNFVSYEDANAYCEWLTEKDGVNTYRLPNESEWELAAGHMPKDADFNCGINDGRTPVEQYASVTRGAHGAVDFWGNVWEWTSTLRSDAVRGVKGGSWKSARTDCRTEYRKEGRLETEGYDEVGFRVLKILNGEEPEQKVELATMDAPTVSAFYLTNNKVQLTWNNVNDAVEYQLFEYSEETGFVRMLDRTKNTSYIVDHEEDCLYIVQPISYIAICDNVSSEYAVKPQNTTVNDCVLEANVQYDETNNSLRLVWDASDTNDVYYVYRYNPETNRLSKSKIITGKTECTYRKVEIGKQYCFIVSTSTKELSSKNETCGVLSAVITIPAE